MPNPDRTLHPVSLPTDWQPSSWRGRTALQLPTYPDAEALAGVQDELRALPPLVTSWEILALKQQIADAQEGRRFLLQGGDCAENFSDCSSDVISNRLKVLLQMSLVLVHGLRLPVVRVGRFAGQYAKPRSTDTETRDGITLPSYRGDMVNAPEFTMQARTPDPRRMVKAHARSAMTMNFVRSLIDGGFADLHHPEYWDLGWVGHSPLADEYHQMVSGIGDAVRFMETLSGNAVHNLNRVDFYTSHEALLLPYEEAQTRQVPRQWGWFNLSTHFPWIGMRTAALDGAHVEYFRGIRNPIAVKIGPSVTPEQLLRLVDVLNPDDEPGRLSLIHRMGAAHVADKLPPLLDAIRRDGRRVLWICDPDARQYRIDQQRLQDPSLRQYPQRDRAVVRHPCRGRHAPGRRAPGTDRRGRDRMHRRRARPQRSRPRARLSLDRRSAPELRAGAGNGDADRAQAGSDRRARFSLTL